MATAKAVIVAEAAAVAAVGLTGLLVVRRDAAQPAIAGKPPPLSTTSMEDWTASVCRPGSFQHGASGLPNATRRRPL